jgi:5'-nucleotidase
MTRVLVTNDDGIEAAGLQWLARAATDFGFQVTVAAPAVESSGSSAAIIAAERDGRIPVDDRDLPGLDGVPAYAVAAPPALITLIATRGAFGDKPDIVLSGINRGANTGRAVLHSGTVGAALTGAANGRSSMAVSLDVGLAPKGRPHWETAARLAADVFPALLEAAGFDGAAGVDGAAGAAVPVVFNLNVPDVALASVRGLRRGALASFGAVQTNVEIGDGFVRMALADVSAKLEPGTDAAWLAAGYASITALNPICEASKVPMPAETRLRPAGTGAVTPASGSATPDVSRSGSTPAQYGRS